MRKMMRTAMLAGITALVAVTAADTATTASVPNREPLIIFDAHEDAILDLLDSTTETLRMDFPQNQQADIPKWQRGGINVLGMAVFVHPDKVPADQTLARTEFIMKRIRKEIDESEGKLVLCRKAADAERAVKDGKIAVFMTIEGGQALNNDPANVRKYAEAGVRSMNLTWNKDLPWAGSVMDEQLSSKTLGRGLNETGVKIVKEMNRAGMVIDLSHSSDQTILDTLKVTTKPVIASHSNARALTPYPRNLTDDQIKGIAATGGVVGIGFAPYFITDNPLVNDLQELDKIPSADLKASIQDVVRHIKYMANLVGTDHVGIGSDFDGFKTTPIGLENAGKMGNLVTALRKEFSEEDVRKILGLNMLRVYRANE